MATERDPNRLWLHGRWWRVIWSLKESRPQIEPTQEEIEREVHPDWRRVAGERDP
jgi:hypothetical protein